MAKKSSSNDSNMKSTMTRVALASLVLSVAPHTSSAFHSSPTQMMVAGPIHPSPSSQTSPTRPSSRRALSTTFLKYTNDSTATTDVTTGWWRNVFQQQSEQDDEQNNVDEYLEFLDRRYNRLHSEVDEKESKPFSALGWLLNGSPKRNEVRAAAHQHEDSLNVLGVAGLASQRLLQKHRLVDPQPELLSTEQSSKAVIDINAESEDDTPSTKFIKKAMAPAIRKYVIFQRAKDVFVGRQLQRLRAFAMACLRVLGKSLVQGPSVTARAVLNIGGGKKTIAITITAVTTVLLLLRPLLQALISEPSMTGTV